MENAKGNDVLLSQSEALMPRPVRLARLTETLTLTVEDAEGITRHVTVDEPHALGIYRELMVRFQPQLASEVFSSLPADGGGGAFRGQKS